jgi:hypothetical protein
LLASAVIFFSVIHRANNGGFRESSMSDESKDAVKAISILMSALRPLDREARVHVLEFVLKRFGISLTAEPAAPAQRSCVPDLHPTRPNPSVPALSEAADMRSFAAEKSPKTVNEKVAVIGYYLAHLAPAAERRDYLISDDIEKYFPEADFHLPAAPAGVTLANAKNAGYLSVLDRGRFKLTTVGHNLVAHELPRGETREKNRKAAKKLVSKKARPKAKKRLAGR